MNELIETSSKLLRQSLPGDRVVTDSRESILKGERRQTTNKLSLHER
jgi:hypothetical protein